MMSSNTYKKSAHTCNFRIDPQADSKNPSIRIKCTNCHGNKQISRQSCDSRLCIDCWKIFCDENDFDPDLSECINNLCKEMGLNKTQMLEIDQYSFDQIFEIPFKKKFRYISDIRYKSRQSDNYDDDSINDSDSEYNEPKSVNYDSDFIVSGSDVDSDADYVPSESEDENYLEFPPQSVNYDSDFIVSGSDVDDDTNYIPSDLEDEKSLEFPQQSDKYDSESIINNTNVDSDTNYVISDSEDGNSLDIKSNDSDEEMFHDSDIEIINNNNMARMKLDIVTVFVPEKQTSTTIHLDKQKKRPYSDMKESSTDPDTSQPVSNNKPPKKRYRQIVIID